jgi:hypothetical protein
MFATITAAWAGASVNSAANIVAQKNILLSLLGKGQRKSGKRIPYYNYMTMRAILQQFVLL